MASNETLEKALDIASYVVAKPYCSAYHDCGKEECAPEHCTKSKEWAKWFIEYVEKAESVEAKLSDDRIIEDCVNVALGHME